MTTGRKLELTNNVIGDYTLSQVQPKKFGQIGSGVGFTPTDGVIRKLTLRDKLQQVINLGQPIEIAGVLVDKTTARVMLIRYKDTLLDAQIN